MHVKDTELSPDPLDREVGRTVFGETPALYEQSRPGYPQKVYQILTEITGAGPGSRAFEIGAGTGKATAELLKLGCHVTAIEPDPRLTALLSSRANQLSSSSRLEIVQAPFEQIELQSAVFDLGVAATAFHWLDEARALTEVKRLLRPGGWWAMWWNVYGDPARPDAFQRQTNHIFSALKRTPSHADPQRPPFALDREQRLSALACHGFETARVETIRWSRSFTTTELLALVATFSHVASLPESERANFLDAIRHVADDTYGGTIEREFLTVIYTARAPLRIERPA